MASGEPAAAGAPPPDAAAVLAAARGEPRDGVATLDVPYSSSELYLAVLEYAAALPPRGGGAPRPLLQDDMHQWAPRREESDDEEKGGAGGGGGDEGRGASGEGKEGEGDAQARKRGREDGAGGSGGSGGGGEEGKGKEDGVQMRKRRYRKPRLVLGLGAVEIVWPPPEGMRIGDLEAGKVGVQAAEGAGEYGEAKGSLWVAHREKGWPMYAGGKVGLYRELRLACGRGEAPLREFAAGVLRWRKDVEHPGAGPGRFALYRFKIMRGGRWMKEGMKRGRSMASVVLPEGMADEIVADVKLFLQAETRRWYLKHGLPHRRCLLLEGPPGTGKTSCINAIASRFNLNCCFLSTTCASFSNQLLGDALAQIPENGLLVLEDVDSLFNEDRKSEGAASLTFSGMLNALDGFMSADGVLTVMTTNHADKLDEALTRGGRVDRRFTFVKPGEPQVAKLFLNFYPDADPALADKFARVVFARPEGDAARSIATLQQLFIAKRSASADECVEGVDSFFDSHFPSGSNSNSMLYS